ncbi:MAG: peptidylprolyl isomerase [Dehalococcoidia bacterium]|nr:peptidylprolyl isomerase [Dehalococcoidia bacterium]
MNNRQWALVLAGIALLLFTACSSPPPPVAEFTATTEGGNAPLEVSFVLGEIADGDSFSWDFGDGTGSDEAEPAHTFQDVGEFTIRLTATKGDQTATAETTVSVEHGEAGWVVIDGGADPLLSGETTRFSATAFDILGNPVVDPAFTWSADPAAGEIDGSGKFTAGIGLGDFKDAISVEFERLGTVVTQSAGVEIVVGPLHAISVEPNELDIRVGRTQTISVRAVDEAGHQLDSVLTLFTVMRGDDSIDSTGYFTAGNMASDGDSELISVEVELDDQVIEATISGSVRPGILDQVHVSSLPTAMKVGESAQLTAFATDRFGNELELDELRWTVTGTDIGSVTASGLFTAGTAAGAYVEEGPTARGVLANIESATTAPVTIVAGPAASIQIVPDGDSVPIGAGSPFEVVALDAHGNVLEVDEALYEYEYSTAGRGDPIGVFIAGYELGDFENAITVTLPAGVAGNDNELVAQSDMTIRQRSANILAVEVIDQDGGTILFIDLETAQLRPADPGFLNNGSVELAPSWWPDGSRLVYSTDLTGTLQTYTLDLPTGEIVQLTDVEGGATMPAISPDGKSIAFVHLTETAWQLYAAPIPPNVATNPITLEDATRVSTDDAIQYVLPYWSPDGTQLLVTENTQEGLVRMSRFDLPSGTGAETLGPFGTVGFGWTVDGTGVHFGLTTNEGGLELGTLELATGERTYIESSIDYLVAAWAPDDSELAAVDSLIGAGWLLDSDGTGLRRAIGSDEFPTQMSWRPKEYGDPVATPAPDPGADGAPAMLAAGDAPAAPIGVLDTSLDYTAVISTELGDITIELYDDLVPLTVENFINLSRIGFYDGVQFHRVVEGFISRIVQLGGALATAGRQKHQKDNSYDNRLL